MLRQLGRLTSRPYTREELSSEEELPISYLTAPVFSAGEARYELQLGPLLPAASRIRRDALIETLRSGAARMSQ
ncbi:hypothetical protein, partial [Staphylococcus aureus]|uniref:hypothetical protein n=1 Tax=Staphylococcus aureus TaxID=1280 RepID=UPI003D13636D